MPGVIKVNPSVYQDKRDAHAVVVNEALRLFQEDSGFVPKFDVTPEQLEFFKGTAYNPDNGAEGTASDAARGGDVLGTLDPAKWGPPRAPGIYAGRAPTDAELYPKQVLRSTVPTPLEAANEATGNQIPSDNAAVNLVNQFISGAGTFGRNKAGSRAGGPVETVHEFEGRAISKATADGLQLHTVAAEQNMRLRAAEKERSLQQDAGEGGISLQKPVALDHHTAAAGPQGFTYDPGRAYRRVGGVEGLRDIADMGGVMPSPVAKENPLNRGAATLYGRTVFFKTGHPEVVYPGPITVEMDSNAATAPERYKTQEPTKRFSGFINAEAGEEGTAASSISRILHDDGTVIYSRERDHLSGLLPAINKHLEENGARPVSRLGEGRAAREAEISAREALQAKEQAEAKSRADKSGLSARLMKR